MSERVLQRVELYDSNAPVYGARKAVIGAPDVLDARMTRTLESERATLVVPFFPKDSDAFGTLALEGDVLLWRFEDGHVIEWRVDSISDLQTAEGEATRTLEAEGIRYDLDKRAGVVRQELVGFTDLDFKLLEQSADAWLDLAMSSTEFPPHFKKGVVEAGPNATIEVDGFSPLAVIDRIQAKTGLELDVERDPADGLYWLHLRSQRGQQAEPVFVALGRQLVESSIVSNVLKQATRITPRGGGDGGGGASRKTLADNALVIDSITSNRIALEGSFIKYDRQLGGPNLLGDDSTAEHVAAGTGAGSFYQYRDKLPLADVAVSVGELVSFGAELRSDTGADSAFLRIEFFTAADASISTHDTPTVTSATFRRVGATVTVPANAAKVTVEAHQSGGTEKGHVRRATLSRTDEPIPYIETAQHVEKPDGTLVEIFHADAGTQELTLESVSNLSPGDVVRVARDSSGADLLSLIKPSAVERYGPVDGILDLRDLGDLDNLLPNGFLDEWTGGVPGSVTILGGAVVTEHTGSFAEKGSSALKLQTSADGDGFEWQVAVSPTRSLPYFVAQLKAWLEAQTGAAELKVRLEDVTNGTVHPAETDPGGRSAQENAWLDFRIPGNTNFFLVGTATMKVRVTQHGSGTLSAFIDAGMLLNREFFADEYARGRVANDLWTEVNSAFDDFAEPELALDLAVIDVYRGDSSVAFNELVVGGDVIAMNEEIGLGPLQARTYGLEENALDPFDTKLIVSADREDIAQLTSSPNRRPASKGAPGGQPLPPSASPPPTGAGGVVYADGQTVESLQPAQAAADVTGQNIAADVVAVGGTAAGSVKDATARALAAITVAGDLSGNVLITDGSNNLVLARGRLPWTAADGGSVVFSPAFQNVPAVWGQFPKARFLLASFFAPKTETYDGGAATVSNSVSSANTDHALQADPADGYVTVYFKVTKTSNNASFGTVAEADINIQDDQPGSFTTRETATELIYGVSSLGISHVEYHKVTYRNASLAAGDNIRINVVRGHNPGGTWSLQVTPIWVEVGAGPEDVIFKIIPNALDAGGFDLIAKVVERAITVAEQTQAFAAGTLTAEGQSLALASTLGSDAGDDEYRATYDGSLSIDSQDTLQTEHDAFPAGTLTGAGQSKERTLDETPNAPGDVTVEYDGTLFAKASGGTATSDAMSGSRTTPGTFAETNLSRNPSGSLTVFFDIPSISGDVTVAVESNDGGAGWVEKASATYTTAGLQFLSWSEGTLDKNDDVRLNVKSGSGSYQVDAVKCDYNAFYRRHQVTVVTEVDKGSGYSTVDTNVHTVTDEDGVEDSLSLAGTDVNFTDGALEAGHKIRLRISAWVTTGAASGEHLSAVAPDEIEYQTGSAQTATLEVTVALDAKDGAGSFVEKATKVHTVEDSSGTGTTLNLVDELLSFFDTAIDTGDDLRLRLKAVVVSGLYDSFNVSIDPDTAFWNEFTGSTTEHSMTPVTGDVLQGIALGG